MKRLGFPEACQFFRGPHSIACLSTIWTEVGCTEDGWSHPLTMTPHRHAFLQRKTIL